MPPSSSTPEPGGLFTAVLDHGPVHDATTDRAWLQAMLDFEAALAGASADAGLISSDDAAAIAAACVAGNFAAAIIGANATDTGNPVVPLVRALTAAVGDPAAAHVHRGATSQDVLDTAAMLIAARALGPLVDDLRCAADAAAGLAREHRDAPAAGRTLLQHAVPVTFGLKAAGWMTALDEAVARLDEVAGHRLAVQLGGAAGTLAALGDRGIEVVGHLAHRLGLVVPVLPWHTDRTRVAELAGALGSAAGVCAKIARDIVLLAQTEVGEVSEAAPGRGGSSTMPHKQNPVAAIAAAGSAARAPGLVATLLAAMTHEHERAAGAWHAEWRPYTDLLRAAGSAAAWLRDSLEHLRVDADRMRANLNLTAGQAQTGHVVSALADRVGRLRAHDLVTQASQRARDQGRPLAEVLAEDPAIAEHSDQDDLRRLLDPAGATGSAGRLVDGALTHHQAWVDLRHPAAPHNDDPPLAGSQE
jgi:3-carboxy-cis,cis-muconate cycloisomerase